MMSPVNILQFSQFTIDWFDELDDADSHGDTIVDEQTDNHALAYEIDTIREVLRYGQDKALFDMLASYVRFCLPNVPGEDNGATSVRTLASTRRGGDAT
jgi:hypothetical protein